MGDEAPSYSTLILISCFAGLGCFTAAHMRIPILPLYARSLGVGAMGIGIINSLFMMAAGTLSMPLGIMSDRFGRKRLVLAGILITALSSLFLSWSRNFPQIMIINAFAGLGLGAFTPTMMSFVADFSPLTHRGRSYAWYTTATNLGMSLGPAIGGLLAQVFSYRRVFSISAIMGFVVFSAASLSFPNASPEHYNRTPKKEFMKIISGLLRNNPLVACWLVTLVTSFGIGVYVSFLALHASDQGVGVGKIGLIFGTQAIVNVLGRIPFGYLGDRLAHRSDLVLMGVLVYSISVLGFGLSSSLVMFLISAVLMGLGMGISFTAVGALIPELVTSDSMGFAMGGYAASIYLGMMLGSLTMGVVAGRFGFRSSFLITAGIIAIGAVAFNSIFKSTPAARMAVEVNRNDFKP
jgi:MFS family permease